MRTVLITGSSDGIGFETAFGLAKAGHRVILHGRDENKLRDAAFKIQNFTGLMPLTCKADLTSISEVQKLADFVIQTVGQLDTLINNAGAFFKQRQESADGFENNLALHHLAPFLLSVQLSPLLEKSADARIINVNSLLYRSANPRLIDPQSEQKYHMMKAYGKSKLYNLYLSTSWHRHFPGSSVKVVALHPGLVNTNLARDLTGFKKWFFFLIRNLFFLSARRGAKSSIDLVCRENLERGCFYVKSEKQPVESYVLSINEQDQIFKQTIDWLRQKNDPKFLSWLDRP